MAWTLGSRRLRVFSGERPEGCTCSAGLWTQTVVGSHRASALPVLCGVLQRRPSTELGASRCSSNKDTSGRWAKRVATHSGAPASRLVPAPPLDSGAPPCPPLSEKPAECRYSFPLEWGHSGPDLGVGGSQERASRLMRTQATLVEKNPSTSTPSVHGGGGVPRVVNSAGPPQCMGVPRVVNSSGPPQCMGGAPRGELCRPPSMHGGCPKW